MSELNSDDVFSYFNGELVIPFIGDTARNFLSAPRARLVTSRRGTWKNSNPLAIYMIGSGLGKVLTSELFMIE